ncbi:unnamed protein product [Parajaminaea phylloscopi]
MPAASSTPSKRATTPRRSTPRRARSSSVASNTSRSSSRPPSSRSKAVKKDADRPALPEERNPKLPADPVPVKLQVIRREERDIIIGRVKLDTTNGRDHGFLLKRFDTDAIAASAMFQLAFPYADGAAEATEMAYLDRKYNTDRANGGLVAKPRTPKRGRPKKNAPAPEDEADALVLPEGSTGVRLQGTWLPCEDAIEVAEEYGLLLYARPLIEAQALLTEAGPQLVGVAAEPETAATPAKAAPTSPPSSNRKRQRTAAVAEPDTEPEPADGAGNDEGEASDEKEIPTTSSTAAVADDSSPKTSTRTRTRKTTKADGTVETKTIKTTTKVEAAGGLTQDEIDEQIRKSKDLAKQVQTTSAAGETKAGGRKRRASNERPTADLDHFAEDPSVNFVSRQVRRGTRAVRRRPVVSAAGAVGAAAAAGVGALAWFAGGNVDVAQQLVQQGLQSLSGFFF